jgi:hypothetical protein
MAYPSRLGDTPQYFMRFQFGDTPPRVPEPARVQRVMHDLRGQLLAAKLTDVVRFGTFQPDLFGLWVHILPAATPADTTALLTLLRTHPNVLSVAPIGLED